ncbi:MAG: penicillin-binding protein 2 [Chloroflexi bacterium]|nr:penicillin-binding protein 2 [Chloroflexota bacterium]
MAKRNATWRVWAVIGTITIGLLVVIARLVQLQIIDHDQYAEAARRTHLSQETLQDRRGAILDRNGYPLAASEDTFDVVVEIGAWEDPARAEEAAKEIAKISGKYWRSLTDTVSDTDVFEVPVVRGLDYEQSEYVKALNLRGVRLVRSSHRVYPEGNIAAQLIGITGRDNNGLTGIENDFDLVLGGARGTITTEVDALGNPLAHGKQSTVPALPGSSVVLTIDRYIQRVAERELDKAIKEHEATGGTIIVVRPETGEILAMVSRPAASLTRPDLSDDDALALLRNRAITDSYEPGSTFKLITMAAALDANEVYPEMWWEDFGVVHVDGWSIFNWDRSVNGSQTVTQILAKSLNTGAAWLSSLLGPDRFYQYVQAFGFGQPSNIGLSGEASGLVRTPENDPGWRQVDMATNAFGQGLSTTPLQLAMAVAAIANDGQAMKPMIVREIAGATNIEYAPEPAGRPISVETARTLREMMGVVVSGIPSYLLDVQGYEVGGKTGTANIADGNGSYKEGAYISSFVGIAPLDDPELAILIKIDEPQGVPWGTVVAAPAFGVIVQESLAYLKIPPGPEALVSVTE